MLKAANGLGAFQIRNPEDGWFGILKQATR